jgi:hypothetical protein
MILPPNQRFRLALSKESLAVSAIVLLSYRLWEE